MIQLLGILFFLSIAWAEEASENQKLDCSPTMRAETEKACKKMSRPEAKENIPAKFCTWHPEKEIKCECCIDNSTYSQE